MIKKIMKSIFGMGVVVAISAIVGTLLLVIAFSVPTSRMKNHVRESISQLKQETDYFSVTKNIRGSQLDNFTEAIYLNAAMPNNKDKGIFTSLYGMNYGEIYKDANGPFPVQNLVSVIENNDFSQSQNVIIRFWNGYLIAVKFFLCFTNYSGIRYFNICMQLFIMFLLLCLMAQKGLEKFILPVFISYLFLNPITLALCMTFAGFFYCTFIPCIIMLLFNELLTSKKSYLYFFEILGICATYFNENYFQLITFGIPLLFYYMINGFPITIKQMLKNTIAFFIFWFVGYAGMMISKWIVLYILTGENIFKGMLHNIIFRFSTSIGDNSISRFSAIKINIGECRNKFIVLAEFIFICYCVIKMRKNNLPITTNLLPLIKRFSIHICIVFVLLFFALARYAIFANHVYIHFWVTYRILVMPLLAFNIVLAIMSSDSYTLK